jgi:predicted DNA-binding protein
MRTNDLLKIWGAFDNKRLCAKQFSIRLPVHVAARVSALCDMYPSKTKTDIIADLLASALDQIEEALPIYKSSEMEEIDGHQFYPNYGPKVDFQKDSNKYYVEFENELGNQNPKNLY